MLTLVEWLLLVVCCTVSLQYLFFEYFFSESRFSCPVLNLYFLLLHINYALEMETCFLQVEQN